MCEAATAIRYHITVDTSFLGDTLRIIDTIGSIMMFGTPRVNTTGASPWTFTTMTIYWGESENTVPPTGAILHIPLDPFKVTTRLDTLRYVTYNDSFWMRPCLYGNVTGRVYIDNNSNCIFDAGDVGLNGCYVYAYENLTSPMMPTTTRLGYSNSGGLYSIQALQSWMVNYTVSLPPAYAFIFPMSPCFTSVYSFTTLPQSGIDFPMHCTGNVDVQCYALSPDHVRLHTPFFMHPYVSNTGCDTMSGTMTLVKDSRIIYNAALSIHPADTVHGDTLIWVYTNLTNLSIGAYWNSFISDIYLTPDTTLVAGDTVCFRVYTNIPPADIDPTNNDYTICLPVVYSYDPNSKDVVPTGTGPLGILPPGSDSLFYTINFQNTGTAQAYEVKIIDTLDSHLDPHSLKILGTSHTMTPYWLAPNVVEFDYQGIMLPDSSANEPASHGQVRFKVKLNSGLPPGTQIKNKGYIYFDSNPAVLTNGTLNTTSFTTGTKPIITATGIKVYPNPATDQITIDDLNAGDIYILNMSGSMLISRHVVSNKTTIDISSLPSGVYMLKTLNDANTSTVKFTKY